MKYTQTTTTPKEFIDKQFAIADTLAEGQEGLPDMDALKTAARFYSNGVQMIKSQLIFKKLKGNTSIEFFENDKK